jgi:prepilin-type N-terminal cleavage/methylation domain-containing protein
VSLNRRGFSLIELVVALALTLLIAALSWSILAAGALRLRDRSERMSLEHSLRVVAAAVRAAIEPVGQDSSAGNDLIVALPDRVVTRTTRGSGALCAATSVAFTARSASGWWSALRNPVPGRDSLLVERVSPPSTWEVIALSSAPYAGPCPDGSAGLVLPVIADSAALAGVGPGSPVRVFEEMELRLYTSSGAAWVGLRSLGTGEAIQPLAGPFTATGLRLEYRSPDGTPVVDPAEVASVLLRATGLTERAGGVGTARGPAGRPDSVVMLVIRRNSP